MDGFGTAKRPLTEVKEEPHERDEDHMVMYDLNDDPNHKCKFCASGVSMGRMHSQVLN